MCSSFEIHCQAKEREREAGARSEFMKHESGRVWCKCVPDRARSITCLSIFVNQVRTFAAPDEEDEDDGR